MIIHRDAFLAILAAAVLTYGLRLGGLTLASRLPQEGRWRRFLDALPATILVSLIAPGVLAEGIWGGVATLVTALCVHKTGNVFVAMLLGMGVLIVQRNLLG